MLCDKAPGPDGFTGAFFRSCWEIIKKDLTEVMNSVSGLKVFGLHWLDSANIVLITKREGAHEVTHYRLISLIHGVARILSKVLALRLAQHLHGLVSHSQNAFIKKRSIHDNYMFMRNLARHLYQS